MSHPIVTALLAYGMSGKVFHAPFLETNAGFELYAVLERNEKKAAADFPSIKSISNIDDLLADKAIELVVVNTPNNTHFDYAKQVLEADKNVLIEKPAATSAADFMELLELAKRVGKQVFVYQNRRYSSDFLATKAVIESGWLGDIVEMHVRFDRYRPTIGPKVFKETQVPGSGIWFDLGAHLVDQAISLFGKPVNHFGKKSILRKESVVDDYSFMHIEFAKKVNVFITASMLVTNPQTGIVIHGTRGSFVKRFCDEQENQLIAGMSPLAKEFGLELPNNEGTLTYVDEHNQVQSESVPSMRGNYNELFEHLYESIRNGKSFPVSNEEIIEQLKLLE